MSGEILVILPGRNPKPIQSLFNAEDIGTLICSGDTVKKLSARKRWLLYTRTRGSVSVDKGAQDALIEKGSSLLPAGIKGVQGEFMTGDVIEIEDVNGNTLGRGITAYSRPELEKVLGMKGEDVRKSGLLTRSEAVIHRNDLILEDLPGLRKFT
jgi:glutamate 5-kinase